VENYVLGAEISTGGMGSVLEAHDAKLDRTVAIKVMLLEGDANPSLRERFLREARVLAMLEHPNIVPIHDLVWEDGRPLFYSMKRVRGRTLGAILTDLRKERPEVLREYVLESLLGIFRKVCDAVAFAHSRGVIHRDLKPDNIMVGEFGEVLVMDWGLARLKVPETGRLGDEEIADSDLSKSLPLQVSPSGLTLHGAVLGTPQYMSPEQARGNLEEVDERSDLYALGGILYAILTLRPPVEGASALEILAKVSRGEIATPTALRVRSGSRGKAFEKGTMLEAKEIRPLPHVRGGRVPAALSAVAMKALQVDKERRYDSVATLNAEVEAYLNGFATRAEEAGAWQQIRLLVRRHTVVSVSLAALLFFSIGFVWKVMASEDRARWSLATAQIALAEVAYNEGDVTGMLNALEVVPDKLRGQSWNYFFAKRDSSLGLLDIPGFREPVSDVAAVPDEAARFAIAGRDGRVGIVDVEEGKLVRVIDTGRPGELRIAVSGDGKSLLSRTSSAGEAILFDLVTGEKRKSFPMADSSQDDHPFLQTLALNHDGTLAAFPDFHEPALHVVDTATGVVRWTKPFLPLAMAFASHGRALALIQHEDYDLRGLSLADGSPVYRERLNAHPNSMAASPDRARLAIGLVSGEIEVHHANNGVKILKKSVASMPIAQVAYSAAGNVLFLGGGASQNLAVDRPLSLLHPSDLAPTGTFHGIHSYPGHLPFAVNHRSGHLLTAQSPPQLWHLPDQALAERWMGGDEGWSCDFLSDRCLLARGEKGFRNRLDLTDPANPVVLEPPFAKSHAIQAVHLSSGMIATACSRNSLNTPGAALSVWQTTKDGLVEKWSLPADPGRQSDTTMHLAFDAAGQRLLRTTPQPDNRLIIYELSSGKVLREFKHEAYKAIFAGGREHIVTISSELQPDNTAKGRVAVIDPEDGRLLAVLEHDSAFYALAASPDRRLIAVGGSDHFVRILDAETLKLRWSFRAHDSTVSALCFHPSRPWLTSGSSDHTIKLWRYEDATVVKEFVGIEGLPRSLTFSPDGCFLATDGRDRAVRIFGLRQAQGPWPRRSPGEQ
jgi:serine/threonine protein kinase/WD40 repeat protein